MNARRVLLGDTPQGIAWPHLVACVDFRRARDDHRRRSLLSLRLGRRVSRELVTEHRHVKVRGMMLLGRLDDTRSLERKQLTAEPR